MTISNFDELLRAFDFERLEVFLELEVRLELDLRSVLRVLLEDLRSDGFLSVVFLSVDFFRSEDFEDLVVFLSEDLRSEDFDDCVVFRSDLDSDDFLGSEDFLSVDLRGLVFLLGSFGSLAFFSSVDSIFIFCIFFSYYFLFTQKQKRKKKIKDQGAAPDSDRSGISIAEVAATLARSASVATTDGARAVDISLGAIDN